MSLINLRQVSLSYGDQVLFDQVDLQINAGDKACLLGRNGVGKSTLLKLFAGLSQPDKGSVEIQKGSIVSYLPQQVPMDLAGTVYHVVASGLGPIGAVLADYEAVNQQLMQEYSEALLQRQAQLQQQIEAQHGWQSQQKVAKVLSQMALDGGQDVAGLSGGWLRRVLLAKALVMEPDILLLDEPTNHLDVEAILWLENFLKTYNKTLIFVSHDRAFMQAIATYVIDVDNGHLVPYRCDYPNYLKNKQAALEAESREQALFDKRLAQEEVWIRQGIKARRTRNEGRVRALEKMRATRQQRRERPGEAKLSKQAFINTGKIVFNVEQVHYAYAEEKIIDDFSTVVMRGDKIGIIGPNGAGKTTLLKLLLMEIEPSQGTVTHGTKLTVAYFDQLRNELDDEKSVQDNVYGGRDTIMIDDKPRHVMSYLQDFLFSPARARMLVKYLSGGERNRLLIAKLLTKPANVLVMDEPTNDLDIETLELLEEHLLNYQGTLLMVSHDRAFLNNVVTSTLVLEGEGKVGEYVGGYDDWQRQRKIVAQSEAVVSKKPVEKKIAKKLNYQQQRELDTLPKTIQTLEESIDDMQQAMGDADFYQLAAEVIVEKQQALAQLNDELAQAYQRWEVLEAERESGE